MPIIQLSLSYGGFRQKFRIYVMAVIVHYNRAALVYRFAQRFPQALSTVRRVGVELAEQRLSVQEIESAEPMRAV